MKVLLNKIACLAGFCLFLFAPSLHGQDTKLYSIIKEVKTEVICKSMTQAIEKHSRIITVVDQKGWEAAQFVCGCDMFSSLQSFSGEIWNASGMSVRKIKKSELQKSEYSREFSTDDYYYYYQCNYPTFPFTVKYEWEVKCNNGLINYPRFMPQEEYHQRVDKASYRIELPIGQDCRYLSVNTQKKEFTITESKGANNQQVIEAIASDLPPIEPEPFGASFAQTFPMVYFAPSRFSFGKTEGSMKTWKEFGEWQYKLLEGRDLLPESLKQNLHEITANCRNDKEKVKAVYEYLGATTRYVSIQLGIGGLQPFPASQVCSTGFGDCKGLTNYAKAMLKELGIPAIYTVISTVNERLQLGFSSADQMNHVILQVPLPNDTLWLECTNPRLPMGYIHRDIAGHDALLITPEGGKVYRLPTYQDSLNTQRIKASVYLSSNGEAKIEVNETDRLFQYEGTAGITYLEPSRQKDRIRTDINLIQADIDRIQITEKKDACPEITLNYRITTNQYGNSTGNRLFIPVNVFRKGFNVPNQTVKQQPIYINQGYSDSDSISIHLPDHYTIEGLPRPVEIQSKFGNFRTSVKVKDKEVLIRHQLFMKKGIYAPEDYPGFLLFLKQVAGHYNGKIILKKE